MVARGWSEAQCRAYVLADNKLAENAGWDKQLLMLEVADLTTLGFDLSLVGFSDRELTSFSVAQHQGLTDPDQIPPTPAEPVSQPGDIWVLGKHRLVCGDCTDADTVSNACNGVAPHLMVTDPPYGVEYDPAWRGQTKRTGKVLNDHRADWRDAWALFPGDVAYVWHASLFVHSVAESLIASEFELRAHIIWAKDRLQLSRGHYHWQHEPCWYAVRKGKTGHWIGDRKQTTLWQIPHKGQDAETSHGTQKPVACMQRPIENNSSPGQAVYDPFCGSGTTIIAAEITGRVCHGIELSPAYVDVGIKRWQDFTGQSATLASTHEPFAELSATRTKSSATDLTAAQVGG
jgi:DNA modification methylase